MIELRSDQESQLYTSLEEKAVWSRGLEYLLVHGIDIAERHNVRLDEIVIGECLRLRRICLRPADETSVLVCHVAWYFRATCRRVDKTLNSEDVQAQTIYFHTNRDCLKGEDSDSLLTPWGYFSLDSSPLPDGAPIPVQRRDSQRRSLRLTYDSTVEGLSALVEYVR